MSERAKNHARRGQRPPAPDAEAATIVESAQLEEDRPDSGETQERAAAIGIPPEQPVAPREPRERPDAGESPG